ncbi:hypothetical protein N7462_001003 [Penicillium macrosclerotiorum]|uniref:uncharacterized protein n=1 Tax=Penicillium macrosclerotiorum TaxID=303699 RepID=UPI00254717FC|nr:uncharacterized protein N7462_001003 [Penicillium macrosclerotiorum]KAJ5698998.1 hypothetical protein N7462_001003 [Penicillium macrosclerotiorum]
MDQFQRLRNVGRLEQYSTARHQCGFYLNVAVSANYVLPDKYALPIKHYLYHACANLIAEHPVLSAIPAADDTQQPYFVRLPQINLDEVVSFQTRKSTFYRAEDETTEPTEDLELQALLEAQHNRPFTAPNAYWRLCVLLDPENDRKFSTAFVFHHALGDGNSGKAFHHAFLQALCAGLTEEPKSLVEAPQTPLLPNLEALHSLPLSFMFLAKKLFQAKIYSSRDPGLWAGDKIQTAGQTRIRLVSFPKSLVTSLRSVCRQESTTITALLQTVVAQALFTHLPPSFSRLNCTGAISMRHWLPDIITDDSMGVYVQDLEESYSRSAALPANGTFPWSETRRSRQTIETVLKRKGADGNVNLLKFVGDYQKELCFSKVGRDRDKSFEVSNVGVMHCEPSSGRPFLEGMVFSQCASVIGNAVGVSVVTGGDGRLVLAISWQDTVVEDALVEGMIRSMRDVLTVLGGRT